MTLRYRTLVLRVATMAAIVLALVITATASPAGASAEGCTALGGWRSDTVCMVVHGSGLYVNDAYVSFVAPAGRPCNAWVSITWFDLSNKQYSQQKSGVISGCRDAYTFGWVYQQNMRAGRVCGAVWLANKPQPGACVSIHA
jgi:hypothetical protein